MIGPSRAARVHLRSESIGVQEAIRAGSEYAVVSKQPGSGSQRNLERRGFRVAYTKVVMAREWPGLSPGQGG